MDDLLWTLGLELSTCKPQGEYDFVPPEEKRRDLQEEYEVDLEVDFDVLEELSEDY
jgi:hypothetical protein